MDHPKDQPLCLVLDFQGLWRSIIIFYTPQKKHHNGTSTKWQPIKTRIWFSQNLHGKIEGVQPPPKKKLPPVPFKKWQNSRFWRAFIQADHPLLPHTPGKPSNKTPMISIQYVSGKQLKKWVSYQWLCLVPLKGGIGGIVHPPIGRKNTTYIPLIYCLLQPKTKKPPKDLSKNCETIKRWSTWGQWWI